MTRGHAVALVAGLMSAGAPVPTATREPAFFCAQDNTAAAQDPATPATPPAAGDEAVARGLVIYGFYCMNCHGGDGRGGRDGGSDLHESEMLKRDDGGKEFAAFLPVGRPDQRMPATPLPQQDIADLWAFLRTMIGDTGRTAAEAPGDAARGARVLEKGGCTSCHRADGDLARIGTRLPDAELRERLLEPRAGPLASSHRDGADAALRRHRETVKKLTDRERQDLVAYLATLR